MTGYVPGAKPRNSFRPVPLRCQSSLVSPTWGFSLLLGAIVAISGFLGAGFVSNPAPALGLSLAGILCVAAVKGSDPSKGVAPLVLIPLVVPVAWIAGAVLNISVNPIASGDGLPEIAANVPMTLRAIAGIFAMTVAVVRVVPSQLKRLVDLSPHRFAAVVRVMSMAVTATAVALTSVAVIPFGRPRVDAYLKSLPVVVNMPAAVTREMENKYCHWKGFVYIPPVRASGTLFEGRIEGEDRPRYGEKTDITTVGDLHAVRTTTICPTDADDLGGVHCRLSLARVSPQSGVFHPIGVPSADPTLVSCGALSVRADEARGLWFVEPGRIAFAMSTEPQVLAVTPRQLKGLRPPYAFPAVAAIGILAALFLLLRQRVVGRQRLMGAPNSAAAAHSPYRHSLRGGAVGEDLERPTEAYAQALAIVLLSSAPLAGALVALAGG